MNVSVLVPWRAGCPHREAAWKWVQSRYAIHTPSWEIVTGECDDGPFNRSEAILAAASRSSGDVLIIADADVWCDPGPAVDQVADHGWAIPHLLVHRLSDTSTRLVLQYPDRPFEWHGLPLSTDNPQDAKPYRGNETGTLVVMRRDVLDDVPPDVRFVGWGQEDNAWGTALRTLIGRPWRGTDDLVHLWHPPQPRLSRVVGSHASKKLLRRYHAARRNRDAMRALIEETVDVRPVEGRTRGARC